MSKYNTKEEVLDAIGVKNIDEVKEKEIDKFIKISGDVAKAVQVELVKAICLNVPSMTAHLLEGIRNSYKETLDANSTIANKQMELFDKTLDSLDRVMNNDNASEEMKKLALEKALKILSDSTQYSKETQDKNIKAEEKKQNKILAFWGVAVTVIITASLGALKNLPKNIK